MKQKIKILISVLFLPPLIAELLSGSAPPNEFFRPHTIFLLVMLYGCGTLLIREARIRWNMQWSVLFLVVAYGIAEEGLMTKAFFNINWPDVGGYARYGTWHGILLPWSILLLSFHATISTLLPIVITDLIWQEYSGRLLLKKKGIVITFTGFIAVIVFGLIFNGNHVDGVMTAYYPEPVLLIVSFILILLLIVAGYIFRGNRIKTPGRIFGPKVFSILAFIFNTAFLIVPYIMAENDISQPVLILYQLLFVSAAFIFAYFQIYNVNITSHHFVNLVSGTLLFMGLFAILQDLGGEAGMNIVGIVFIIMLFIWRRIVLRGK